MLSKKKKKRIAIKENLICILVLHVFTLLYMYIKLS